MGRRVYELVTNEFVWKYSFAEQCSEQFRINTELKLGKYEHFHEEQCDVVTLTQKDRRAMEKFMTEAYTLKLGKGKQAKSITETTGKHHKLTRRKMIRTWMKLQRAMFLHKGILVGSLEEQIRAKIRNEIVPDILFWEMIEAYIQHMKKHPNIKEFKFQGEF